MQTYKPKLQRQSPRTLASRQTDNSSDAKFPLSSCLELAHNDEYKLYTKTFDLEIFTHHFNYMPD